MHLVALIILLAGAESSPEATPLSTPPLLEAAVAATRSDPPSRFGVIAVGGAEVAVPSRGGATLGVRLGGGLRVALMEREPDALTGYDELSVRRRVAPGSR